MTLDSLLGFLEYVKPTRRGWQARCPAHPDKSPSLSIQAGDGGRILLYCFAGCTAKEICTALGLRMRCAIYSANGWTQAGVTVTFHALRQNERWVTLTCPL